MNEPQDSAEADEKPQLSTTQCQLLEDRLATYRANPDDVLSWEEAEAELWPEG